MKNLSTGIEASATGESLNSGDPAVHPAARHRLLAAAVVPVYTNKVLRHQTPNYSLYIGICMCRTSADMQSRPSARVCAAQVLGHSIRLVRVARVIFVASALLPGYDRFTCLQQKQPGKSSSFPAVRPQKEQATEYSHQRQILTSTSDGRYENKSKRCVCMIYPERRWMHRPN